MFCYAVFHKSIKIRVFPYEREGRDWQRARTLAIELANGLGKNHTVEHFGASGVGTVVWL
jgi:hypothetical protein